MSSGLHFYLYADQNECSFSPCEHGGTCVDQVNGFICLCAVGYEGTKCEDDSDDCNSNPCLNGGWCTDAVGSFLCNCSPGYDGVICGSGLLQSVSLKDTPLRSNPKVIRVALDSS